MPVCTFAKLSEDGLAARTPGVTPVPESGMARVAALLTRETLPGVLPADWGANTTEKLALSFAAKITGKVSPVTLYPAPLGDACVMVTLDPPVLVTVSGRL